MYINFRKYYLFFTRRSIITQYDSLFSQDLSQRFLMSFYLLNKTAYSDFLLYVRIFHKLGLKLAKWPFRPKFERICKKICSFLKFVLLHVGQAYNELKICKVWCSYGAYFSYNLKKTDYKKFNQKLTIVGHGKFEAIILEIWEEKNCHFKNSENIGF
jgi:hypothetical protein